LRIAVFSPKCFAAANRLEFEEGFVKAYKESQYLKHALYGFGVVTESDSDRTTIKFDTYGEKKFVTSMVVVELVDGDPPKAARGTRRKKAAAKEVAPEAAAATKN
jgi:hypothetical protein